MNKYLKEEEMLPEEKIVGEIPYKPFSILIVTNQRIIGKRIFRIGPKRFEGIIFYDKIVSVKYISGIPLVTTPGILVEYKQEGEKVKKVTIRFPDFTVQLAGFDPKGIYWLIVNQINTRNQAAA